MGVEGEVESSVLVSIGAATAQRSLLVVVVLLLSLLLSKTAWRAQEVFGIGL